MNYTYGFYLPIIVYMVVFYFLDVLSLTNYIGQLAI